MMLKKLPICILLSVLSLSFIGSITVKAQNISQTNDYIQKLIHPESRYMQIHDEYIKNLDPLSFLNNTNQRNTQDELSFLLDTVCIYSVSANPMRYIHTYSQEEGLQLTSLVEIFENDSWLHLTLDECTYDDSGNKLTSLLHVWNNEAWVNASKDIYTYTVNNNMDTCLHEIWENGNWENDNRSTYSYNVSGKVVSHLIELFDNGKWENHSKEIYGYDDSENMVYALGEFWMDSAWLNNQQYTYTNDINGNILNGLSEIWENGVWKNLASETYTYNTVNKRLSYLGEAWNDSVWVNEQKYTYTYDDLDYLEMSIGEEWENDIWVYTEKGQYSHDTYGGIETSYVEIWENDDWMNFSMTQYNYDDNGNALTGNYYNWDGNTWVQNEEGIMQLFYNYSTEVEYFMGYLAEAHYTSLTVGLNESLSNNINSFACFPNPASVSINLNIDIVKDSFVDINLFDITGKKIKAVFHGKLNSGKHQYKISTEQIPAGIYIVSMVTDSSKNNTKILISK